MKLIFLVIAFLFISTTAWGSTWSDTGYDIAQGILDGMFPDEEELARRKEQEWRDNQAEREQQLLEQQQQLLEQQQQQINMEQQRINTEQQLILQQKWQLIQQQQQQLSHAQLDQKKELRLQLQKQELLQKRQEFIQLYLITTESGKAKSTVTHSTLSVNSQYTIDSPSNKYAFFATKLNKVYHKPNCPKLYASFGLIRFDTQQKACKAGYLPCNYCKPD